MLTIVLRGLTREQRILLGLDPKETKDLEVSVSADKINSLLALLEGNVFKPVILITPAQQDVTPWAPVNGC